MNRIIKDYLLLNDLNEQHSEFLFLCIEEMNKNGEFILNAAIKRRMIVKLRVKLGSLNNVITKLINQKVLIRIDRSIYKVCEDLEQIIQSEKEIINLVLRYEKEDRQILITEGDNEE